MKLLANLSPFAIGIIGHTGTSRSQAASTRPRVSGRLSIGTLCYPTALPCWALPKRHEVRRTGVSLLVPPSGRTVDVRHQLTFANRVGKPLRIDTMCQF